MQIIQAGDWALVTGASAGIGREFCRQLAGAGLNLVLVARRRELLEALAGELAGHGIRTLILVEDLTEVGAPARIRSQVEAAGVRIRLLVNNAGCGKWGAFDEATPEIYDRMIRLNVAVPTALCLEFLPHLKSHSPGAIINVSSQAALQPVPYMAVYAASKAYLQSLSLALHEEWRASGVHVQTLMPGPTATEFDARAGAYESAVVDRRPAAEVVRAALAHLGDGRPFVASVGGIWKQRFFAGLFPYRMVVREVAKMFKPPAAR